MKLGCVIYYFVPEFGNDITLLKTSLRRRAVRQHVGYKHSRDAAGGGGSREVRC